MPTKKCPVCGVSVKVENLERHVRNQHPRSDVNRQELLTMEERAGVDKTKSMGRPTLTKTGVRVIAVVGVIIAIVLAVVILNPPATGLGAGQAAPNFSATTTDGTTVTLSNYRGQPVLIEFMDVDCPHCINEAPVLGGVWDVYGNRVYFLSLDANFVGSPDTGARIVAFKTQYNTTWDYALPDASLVQLYQVTVTPTIFVINGKGVIVQVFHGETTATTLSTAINTALQG